MKTLKSFTLLTKDKKRSPPSIFTCPKKIFFTLDFFWQLRENYFINLRFEPSKQLISLNETDASPHKTL